VRYKLNVYSAKDIREYARKRAQQVIQSRREIDEGFTAPHTEAEDRVTEQMNISLSELYRIHTKASSCHKDISNIVPSSARYSSALSPRNTLNILTLLILQLAVCRGAT
jgi:hypothetical protein